MDIEDGSDDEEKELAALFFPEGDSNDQMETEQHQEITSTIRPLSPVATTSINNNPSINHPPAIQSTPSTFSQDSQNFAQYFDDEEDIDQLMMDEALAIAERAEQALSKV